ncbi:hypothetical protein HDV62DRAFT_146173 [Trichoderma sp. SZMC 28011]
MLGGQDIIISRPCPPLAASCRIPLAFRSLLSFLALPAISCIFLVLYIFPLRLVLRSCCSLDTAASDRGGLSYLWNHG